MSFSAEDVQRVAHLARIEIDAQDAEAALAQLAGIFGLIASMQAVDTAAVEPMAHASDLALRLREDAVTETDRRDDFQAIAPQVEAGLYLVPKVIE